MKPNDSAAIDTDALRAWIGRRESVADVITHRLEAGLRAVFDRPSGDPQVGDPATPTIHWRLAPPIAPMSGLGPDGPPACGGFMPPLPLPRRMWAGGALTLLEPLRVGDIGTKTQRSRM